MQQNAQIKNAGPAVFKRPSPNSVEAFFTNLFRILVSLLPPILALVVLYPGFVFLRDSQADKLVVAAVAIVWGVGGAALLYAVWNWSV